MYHLVCMPCAALVLFRSVDSVRMAKEKRIHTCVRILLSAGGGYSWFWKQLFDDLKVTLTIATFQDCEISIQRQLSCPSASPSDCFC